MNIFKIFSKGRKEELNDILLKTKKSFWSKFTKAIVGKSTIDKEVLDNIEELLITSDVGVNTTSRILEAIEKRIAKDRYLTTHELNIVLQEEVEKLLHTPSTVAELGTTLPRQPYILLVVGVNGVGKTTTIGKLASKFLERNQKVILGAADTFRAAAIEQLTIWGNRVGVPVVAHSMGSDPSSVAYDTVQEGIKTGANVIIIDTAGRLHNKVNLMSELTKIKRTIQKCMPDAPHEVLLVLDGSTGQNALVQAKVFIEAVAVTSIAITKLDGTSKGGVVLGIAAQFNIPIKYIGLGEGVGDLKIFDKKEFVASLFEKI